MKKSIIFVLLFLFSFNLFSQEFNNNFQEQYRLHQDVFSDFSYFKSNYKPGNKHAMNNIMNLGFDFLLSSSPKNVDRKWSFSQNQSLSEKWKKDFDIEWKRYQELEKTKQKKILNK